MKFCRWILVILLFTYAIALSQDNQTITELEGLAVKYEKDGNILELARCQSKLGALYQQNNNNAKSVENYLKAIKSNETLGNIAAVKNISANLGMYYADIENYDQALVFFKKALKISEKQDKKPDIVSNLINIAQSQQSLKSYAESNKNLERAATIAQELEDMVSVKVCYTTLSENYDKLGNQTKSKEYFELASSIKSHLQKQEINKFETRTQQAENEVSVKDVELRSKDSKIQHLSREQQLTLDLLQQQKEVSELKDRELQSQNKLQQEQNKLEHARKKNTRTIISSLGLILLMAFASMFFIFKQLRAKKKANALLEQSNIQITQQKQEIEKQRDIANTQKKKITDSIMYAQRIQNAVLPPLSIIEKALPDHFILYRPKDIVSGDFYWMTEKEGFVIIAAVDCTGHGVPGAFMSMLGVAFLNDIINKATFNRHFRTLTASNILNQLREHVILSLHQSGMESESKDGMDISLTIIDFEGMHLQFAGAHNPIYIIRANNIIQMAGDPMPIGVYRTSDKPFTNQEFELEENDLVYLFTDGYYDQFGGTKGSKMLSANFRKYLLEIHHKPMKEQKKLLEEFYNNWKGTHDQLDDVTVIGFRFQPLYKISNAPQYKLWHNKRILIAEDVELNFLLLVEALKPTQAKIFRVENGRDAVEYCRNNDIDLVLMDIHMPIMNGIEATKLIKSFKPLIPVVAQTAVGSQADIDEIMEAGCIDFVAKPINLKTFLSTVRKHLIK